MVLVCLYSNVSRSLMAAARSSSLLTSLREVLAAIKADVMLPSLMLAYSFLMFFAPSTALLLPVFATEVVRRGASGLGSLFPCTGSAPSQGRF